MLLKFCPLWDRGYRVTRVDRNPSLPGHPLGACSCAPSPLCVTYSPREKLEGERRNVDEKLERLDAVLNSPPEQELVDGLRIEIANYRQAANAMAHESPGSLVRYHREVNPLLRRAVGFTARLRDRHFEEDHEVGSSAHDEVVRARRVVLGISLVSLIVSILLA